MRSTHPTCVRNYNKFRLRGLIGSIGKMIASGALTMHERNQLSQINYQLEHMEIAWEDNSPTARACYQIERRPL